MEELLMTFTRDGALAHLITVIGLCWLVAQAARVTGYVSAHADKIGNDGWKKLLAVRKSSADCFLTVAVVIAILLRFVDRLSQDLFIAIFIAYLGCLGIRFTGDFLSMKSLAKEKDDSTSTNKADSKK